MQSFDEKSGAKTCPLNKNTGGMPAENRRHFSRVARLSSLLAMLLSLAVLSASAQTAQSITLAWDPSPDPAVTGYNVYYGGAGGSYTNITSVSNVTSTTISGLAEGVTYYFVVTATDGSGDESVFSNEVSYSVPAAVLPSPQQLLMSLAAHGSLAWDPSPDPTVTGYNVHYGGASGNYTNITPVGNVTNTTISGLTAGVTYYFAVTATDGSGDESVFSNEVSYSAPASV